VCQLCLALQLRRHRLHRSIAGGRLSTPVQLVSKHGEELLNPKPASQEPLKSFRCLLGVKLRALRRSHQRHHPKSLKRQSVHPLCKQGRSFDSLAVYSRCNKQADDDDDLLKYCSELDLQTPLTKAKIVTTSEIYAATTSGHLFKVEINKDAQEVPYLQKNKVPVYETDSAIWDFVWFQPEGHD